MTKMVATEEEIKNDEWKTTLIWEINGKKLLKVKWTSNDF